MIFLFDFIVDHFRQCRMEAIMIACNFAALIVNGFDGQERNLTFVKTNFQV